MMMRPRRTCLIAVYFALASVTTATAASLPRGVTQGPAVEGITEYRLPNGLKVLLFPDSSKPTVTVNVTYLVGSRHENYGETGMAHLLEHMMFKGAPKNRHITEEFTRRGMQYNGTTALDRTNYYEVFPAGDANLQWALQMEAERMVKAFIARKDLDSEMTVVRNEYESGENSPGAVLMKRMQSIGYDWHSYGRSTIGNRSDIENVGIANLQAFYHTWYQPDNAVLLVAGKFDPARTLAWISQQFGAIPKPKRSLPKFWTVEPVQDGERSFNVRRQGDVQVIALGYKVPAALHDDSDALSFASDILGAAPTGRLHKLLVDSGKASEVFANSQTGYAPGMQFFGAVVRKGDPIEPVREILTSAVESFATTPPTKAEMERVRRTYTNEIDKSLNDPQQVGVALSESIALGDWRLFFAGRERIASMTAEEVAAAAGRYLRRDNRVTGHFLPDDAPQRAEIPAAPSAEAVLRHFRPVTTAQQAEDFEPSQANIMKRTTLATVGGLKLALLPKKNRGQAVSVDLRLHWGDEHNLFGKGPLPALTSAMLTRGTSKYTREQLSDAFDELKVSGSLLQFETTRPNLVAALRLVAHVLREANFPASEFEQLRGQSIVAIEGARNEPEAMAARALAEHYNHYPKGDVRAAQSIDEEVADLKAVQLEQGARLPPRLLRRLQRRAGHCWRLRRRADSRPGGGTVRQLAQQSRLRPDQAHQRPRDATGAHARRARQGERRGQRTPAAGPADRRRRLSRADAGQSHFWRWRARFAPDAADPPERRAVVRRRLAARCGRRGPGRQLRHERDCRAQQSGQGRHGDAPGARARAHGRVHGARAGVGQIRAARAAPAEPHAGRHRGQFLGHLPVFGAQLRVERRVRAAPESRHPRAAERRLRQSHRSCRAERDRGG